MPAITRVMRIVSGMVRAEGEGHRNLILMDRRYQDRRILNCFPRFYDIKLLEGERDLIGGLGTPEGS